MKPVSDASLASAFPLNVACNGDVYLVAFSSRPLSVARPSHIRHISTAPHDPGNVGAAEDPAFL